MKLMKSQSAMEYLMTYGWAILIIAVVIALLNFFGVFNPMTFAPKASPGACSVYRPSGTGTVTQISLTGDCTGDVPKFVASFSSASPSYIIAPGNSLAVLGAARSIFGWIYVPAAPSSTNEGLFGWGSALIGHTQVLLTPDMQIYLPSGITTTNSVSVGVWTLVGFTYTTAGNTVVYICAQGQCTTTSAVVTYNTAALRNMNIGRDVLGTDYFNGEIANVQTYNSSLSSNSVQALYHEGIGGPPIDLQDLTGWWPLNGDTNDYSGNGNNGVPNSLSFNGDWWNGYSTP